MLQNSLTSLDEQREGLKRIKAAFDRPIPPELISTRQGNDGFTFDYIKPDVVRAALHESGLVWEWAVNDIHPVGVGNLIIGFEARGTLSIEGIRRDGVGNALLKTANGKPSNVDLGSKDAETDAFKRAAAKFGRLLGAELIDREEAISAIAETMSGTPFQPASETPKVGKNGAKPLDVTPSVPGGKPSEKPDTATADRTVWTTPEMVQNIDSRKTEEKIQSASAWVMDALTASNGLLKKRLAAFHMAPEAFWERIKTAMEFDGDAADWDARLLNRMKTHARIGVRLLVSDAVWASKTYKPEKELLKSLLAEMAFIETPNTNNQHTET